MTHRDRAAEVQHFKLFRRLLKDFPHGEVSHSDKPDFLIQHEGEVIGVEHTQLTKPTSSKRPALLESEASVDELLRVARQHAEISGVPPLWVSLACIGAPAIPKGQQRVELARSLMRLVRANVPSEGKSIRLEVDDIPGVDGVYIDRNNLVTEHHWYAGRGGWVMTRCVDLLQNAISQKRQGIDEYLKRCSRCWLLLVADGGRPSSAIRPDDASQAHVYASAFERTFFMRCVDQSLIELHTRSDL